jgi:DNA-binding transcriptional MerR regulator
VPTPAASAAPATAAPEEWTVDELAHVAGVPVRTIREYQSRALVPAPRRHGRVGMYNAAHLERLRLIDRLQARGYSLAGIADLLGSWRDGGDLAEVLGLDPDQLVHVDEPGAPATLEQLHTVLPAFVPDRLPELLETGVVEACGPDRYCVPSPSLLQLTADAAAAGLDPDRVLAILRAIRSAADLVAGTTLRELEHVPADADATAVRSLLERGRGLLAHGVGRLTVHQIGRALGITDESEVADGFDRLARGRNGT